MYSAHTELDFYHSVIQSRIWQTHKPKKLHNFNEVHALTQLHIQYHKQTARCSRRVTHKKGILKEENMTLVVHSTLGRTNWCDLSTISQI